MGKLGLTITVVAIITISFLSFMPDSENDVLVRLKEAGIHPKPKLISFKDSLQIRAMQIGDSAKPVLLLIHGSPGDWSAWENIIANDSIREVFQVISIDRAGFGETTVPPLENLADQAIIVWSMMKELSQTHDITVAGHSYGGAVVEQLLIDHPAAFIEAIMIAPTLGPELMAPRWYNKVANWSLMKKLISNDLLASNIEMTGLPLSLQINETKLKEIETPIIYIQGMEDILVPYETVEYFKEHKPYGVKYIIIEDMNHFTLWSDPQLIIDALLGKSKFL